MDKRVLDSIRAVLDGQPVQTSLTDDDVFALLHKHTDSRNTGDGLDYLVDPHELLAFARDLWARAGGVITETTLVEFSFARRLEEATRPLHWWPPVKQVASKCKALGVRADDQLYLATRVCQKLKDFRDAQIRDQLPEEDLMPADPVKAVSWLISHCPEWQ